MYKTYLIIYHDKKINKGINQTNSNLNFKN